MSLVNLCNWLWWTSSNIQPSCSKNHSGHGITCDSVRHWGKKKKEKKKLTGATFGFSCFVSFVFHVLDGLLAFRHDGYQVREHNMKTEGTGALETESAGALQTESAGAPETESAGAPEMPSVSNAPAPSVSSAAVSPVSSWTVLSFRTGLPSRGGDVAVYVYDVNQPSLPTPFYSVLVSVSVFMAPSPVFHSINSPDNSPLSYSVLSVLFLPYWSFQLYISLWKSPSALIYSFVVGWA